MDCIWNWTFDVYGEILLCRLGSSTDSVTALEISFHKYTLTPISRCDYAILSTTLSLLTPKVLSTRMIPNNSSYSEPPIQFSLAWKTFWKWCTSHSTRSYGMRKILTALYVQISVWTHQFKILFLSKQLDAHSRVQQGITSKLRHKREIYNSSTVLYLWHIVLKSGRGSIAKWFGHCCQKSPHLKKTPGIGCSIT